jgi:septum formation protein
MREFILASQSPRRSKVLTEAGYVFKVVPSNIKEHLDGSLPLAEAMKRLAQDKAEAVATDHPEAVVLAADTVVSFGGEVIGKPKNKDEARHRLKQFSGATQEVLTGFCIINKSSRTIITGVEIAQVTFRELTDKEIEAYISTDEPYDKGGGYNIEETAKQWVARTSGLKSTIIGLPIEVIQPYLKTLGVVPSS